MHLKQCVAFIFPNVVILMIWFAYVMECLGRTRKAKSFDKLQKVLEKHRMTLLEATDSVFVMKKVRYMVATDSTNLT